MKKVIIILILGLKIPLLNAQEVIRVLEPILIENETIEELRINETIIDEIRFEGELIHLEVEKGKDVLKYFRAKESLYFFRHISNGQVLNKGYYKISKIVEKVDSVFTIHPETYEERLCVTSYSSVEKNGDWVETIDENIYWQGKYDEGIRTGRWFKSSDNINFYKYGEYLNGELLMLYNPNKFDLEKNLNWVTNKPYDLCLVSFIVDESNSEIENWW